MAENSISSGLAEERTLVVSVEPARLCRASSSTTENSTTDLVSVLKASALNNVAAWVEVNK